MAVKPVLQLGNPLLFRVCEPVCRDELSSLEPVIADMLDTLRDYRRRTGAGRALAAPQLGVLRRLVVMETDRPQVLFNPVLDQKSRERFTLWDDCLSFPGLRVRVSRHRRCRLQYRDRGWISHTQILSDDLSELLQHECDHLDGILAVSRALDRESLAYETELKKREAR